MKIKESLSLDDVLLVPKHSTIKSRSEVDTSIQLGTYKYKHPVIPANMKTICGKEMAQAIIDSGGLAILHRFMSLEEQLDTAKELISNNIDGEKHLAVSVGVKQEDKNNIVDFINAGVRIFCIDIAHGDSLQCIEMIQEIKKYEGDNLNLLVIAGNVATGSGAKRLWEAGADVVKVGVGPGCFAAGTRILMSNGFYKNIEGIKPGEYVINKDGNPVEVLNAFSTGIRNVSKLKNNSFYDFTYVTPDHQFWVGDLNSVSKKTLSSRGFAKHLDKFSKTIPKKSKYKWKSIENCKQDVFLFPKKVSFKLPETFSISLDKRNGGNWRIGSSYEKDSEIIPSYDSGYLFGTFLGDGNASCTLVNGSHSGQVKWFFGREEQDIANKVKLAIKNIFKKDAIIVQKESTLDVIFYYKPLADFLNKWGKKTKKYLPENLLVNNLDYLKGLYDGLLDSDGHYAKDGRNSLVNTSFKIVELFNVLNIILFKYVPNNRKREPTIGGLSNCNILNCNASFESKTLKNYSARFTKNYFVVKNLSFEPTDMDIPVYDLTVNCESHSFIANNMIVHNSLCSTRVETAAGTGQFSAIEEVLNTKKEVEILLNKPIQFIADGGIKNSGDLVKCLAFADAVMCGSIFSACPETPGDILEINGKPYKSYVGSSTHKTDHIEGVAALAEIKPPFKEILNKLMQGVRSGCSYQGCRNLTELKEDPEFIKITSAGLRESHPHDIQILK